MKFYNIFALMASILLFSSSQLLASIEGKIVNVKRSTNIGSIIFNEADQSLIFKDNGEIITKFLENDNYLVVEGWACNTGNSEESTSVELFVGESLLGGAIANLEVRDIADPAVEEDYPNSTVSIPYPNEAKSMCNGRTNIGYRFILHEDDLLNSKYFLSDYQYQNIRVEGISLTGAQNVRLANSDRYQMPFMDNHPLETLDNDYTPPECTEQEKRDILSASSSENIRLKCNLTLTSGEAVQGKIIIGGYKGSNISIDCSDKEVGGLKNGLIIRSAHNKNKNKWDAPEGIVVKNCKIDGQLLILGIPPAGDDYKASSRTKEHPFLTRAAAPKHILLENNIFHGKGKEPIYIAPGAGYITIKGSRFTGKSEGTVIYLDAETYRVSILNNSFTTSTERENLKIFTSRELIAIDGSSHNLIKNNVFDNVEYGGIFIYRNCGESGITRHTTPVYNRIIKNKFHFGGGWFSIAKDAVQIASRNGERSFCDDENGTSPFGSASNDRDQAMFNVVVGNDFFDYPDGVDVQNNEINNIVMRNKRHGSDGSYIIDSMLGSLNVNISPIEAVSAGAQWRITGDDTWRNSDETQNEVEVGTITIEFKTISGWTTPKNQQITVNNKETTETTGTYIKQFGSLTVTIEPSQAIYAGAKWRVDDGEWQDSGATQSEIPVGDHIVEFNIVPGFATPAAETVTIKADETATVSQTYTVQAGSLTVNISPPEAVDAGAMWRVRSFNWKDSGETQANFAVGDHWVELKDIAGWQTPDITKATIFDGQTTTLNAVYVKRKGTLAVTSEPPEVISAGAKWRVNGGPWQDSGDAVTVVEDGTYTVEFMDVTGWTTPDSQSVTITDGESVTTSGTYVRSGSDDDGGGGGGCFIDAIDDW